MVSSDDTYNLNKETLAKLINISADELNKIMDASNTNVGIFFNSNYSDIRQDPITNEPKLLNKMGDNKYYATRSLVKHLFKVSNSSAEKLMNESKNLPYSASQPTHDVKKQTDIVDTKTPFFNSPLEEQINVEYYDKHGHLQSKQFNGILLSKVLEKYDQYNQSKDFNESPSGEGLMDEQRSHIDKLREELEKPKGVFIKPKNNHENQVKGTTLNRLPYDNDKVDMLLNRLHEEQEAYALLSNQFDQLRDSIAVYRTDSLLDDEPNYLKGSAYDDYVKWLQNHAKTEPNDNHLKK